MEEYLNSALHASKGFCGSVKQSERMNKVYLFTRVAE